jgi:aspartyl-tRNA(Asn)/glutamyl-tRNA(Gln) amidotransferase subunit C
MLDEKEVEHIAKLARLGLNSKEKGRFQKELSSILEFVEQLNKVETFDTEPMSQVVGLKNISRQDQKKDKSKDQMQKLLDLAPERSQDFYKVKQIL